MQLRDQIARDRAEGRKSRRQRGNRLDKIFARTETREARTGENVR